MSWNKGNLAVEGATSLFRTVLRHAIKAWLAFGFAGTAVGVTVGVTGTGVRVVVGVAGTGVRVVVGSGRRVGVVVDVGLAVDVGAGVKVIVGGGGGVEVGAKVAVGTRPTACPT